MRSTAPSNLKTSELIFYALYYRSLTAQPPAPAAAPVPAAPASSYNLGHYFPRVASEPPSRKSYQTATRNGDPLKVTKKRL